MEPGCILKNCQVADRVEISPYTIAQDSRIDSGRYDRAIRSPSPGQSCGGERAYRQLRRVKKNPARSGRKSGAPGLSGDSEIGAGSNIGAGTIFCNYDGTKKHKTNIGEGSFIGSNSTLVAPVHVGSGAYVAAGSVITMTVPDDALGIGRSRQTVKEGWAKRRREKQADREPRT